MTEVRVNKDKSWSMLKTKLLENTPRDSGSYSTGITGLTFHRYTDNEAPKPHFFQPVIIVVVQGEKWVRVGDEEYRFGDNLYFMTGVDMPASSCVMDASAEKPYLSLSLDLDPGLIASLAFKTPPASINGGGLSKGAVVQDVAPDLLDALLRLVELTEKPAQIPVMAELLLREIHYRLLDSPYGEILRKLNSFGTQSNQITRSIAWLKDHFTEPLLVEELAVRMHMAPSTFHKYFKEVTTLSPLQYQKRLRLNEAQRLMFSQGFTVAEAAFAVGYESATQFMREYKRLFGKSPRKDVLKMQSAAYAPSNRALA